MRRQQAPKNHVGEVHAEAGGQAVGINYGTVIQQHFSGSFALLRDATISLDQLPSDVGLVDPQNPRDLFGLFRGRQWLLEQIDEFAAACGRDRQGGYLFVEAEAGMGKSALAAYLAFTRNWPTHATRSPGGTSPEAARTNLSAQLIARWQLANAAPAGVLPAGHDTTLWLYQRLCEAATRRDAVAPGVPVVLLVDGLDEAPKAPAGELPLGLPTTLPPGCAVIATTRPGVRLPTRLGRVEHIEVESQFNRDDLYNYLNFVTSRDAQLAAAIDTAGIPRELFCRRLLDAAGGVWIYAVTVLAQIQAGRSAKHLDDLPANLAGYYTDNIERWRDDRLVDWANVGLPLLAMLAAARQPLSGHHLADWARLEIAPVQTLLRGVFRPFLVARSGGDPDCYGLRHESLRQLCHGRLPDGVDRPEIAALAHDLSMATQTAHRRICEAITPTGGIAERDWATVGTYAHQNLAMHAAIGGMLDDLVGDPGFLVTIPVAEIARQRQHLTTDQGRTAVSVLEMASSSWTHPEKRSTWLHVVARKLRHTVLADLIERQWLVGWAARHAFWRGVGHRQLIEHTGEARTLAAVGLPDGRQLLAVACDDGTVQVWDPEIGKLYASLGGRRVGRAHSIARVEMSDGSQLLAASGDDGTVRLWDPVSRSVRTILEGHTGWNGTPSWVGVLATVGLPDGRKLLAAGFDRNIRLWDLESGQVHATLECRGGLSIGMHSGSIDVLATVCLSSGRQLLAAAGINGMVWLWDPESAQLYANLEGHDSFVESLMTVELPDGRQLLASAALDNTVWLWDPESCQAHATLEGGLGQSMATVRLSDGRQMLAGSAGRSVRLWDPDSGRLNATLDDYVDPEERSSGRVEAFAAVTLPDGRQMLASAGSPGTVRLWDPNSGQVHAPLEGHLGRVNYLTTVDLSGGRQLLASAGSDRTVRIWNPEISRLHASPDGHLGRVYALTTVDLPDGRQLLASAGDDRTVRLWDPESGQAHAVLKGLSRPVHMLTTVRLPNDKQLLVANDGRMRLWDPESGRPYVAPGSDSAWTALGFGSADVAAVVALRDGRQLLASGDFRRMRLWDPGSGQVRTFEGQTGRTHAVTTIRLSNGRQLLAVEDDGMVRLWDPESGQIRVSLEGHAGPVHAMTAVPLSDGRQLLATASTDRITRPWDSEGGQAQDRAVRLWNPKSGREHAVLDGHTGLITAMAMVALPDGRQLLASASMDQTVRLWEPESGQAHATLEGHTAPVNAMATIALPDGRQLLASAGIDQMVRLWEPESGQAHATLEGHTAPVMDLATVRLTDGAQLLASAGNDGCVLLWAPLT